MNSLRTATRSVIGIAMSVVPAVLLAVPPTFAGGGNPGPGTIQAGDGEGFGSLADLQVSYARKLAELDRKKLADLAALAQRQSGIEAEAAYRAAFDLAVARGFYTEAAPVARAYLAREHGEPESHALAASIILIGRAERGEYDGSLADLKGFLAQRAAAQVADEHRLTPPLVCAVGEAYLQRLIHGGRFDIAREVCRLFMDSDHPDPVIRHYFGGRLARLEMIGKPAPAIEGSDVDGKTVRLADLKGRVVLVDFWASWCPPSVASFPHIRDLLMTHRGKGFAVIGVNLDELAHDPSGKKADPKEILSAVRWFLLQHRAAWPNIVGEGAEAAAKAYGVNEVPAGFLIGRDGVIQKVELNGRALAQAVEEALQGQAAGQK
jgi:thiol-disulfide isomerase/thioredoxin